MATKNVSKPYDFKQEKNYLNYTNGLSECDVIVILQELEFAWKKRDIEKVCQMWRNNYSFNEITSVIKREGDEVFLLLLHLSRKGRIKMRKGYIWGEKE